MGRMTADEIYNELKKGKTEADRIYNDLKMQSALERVKSADFSDIQKGIGDSYKSYKKIDDGTLAGYKSRVSDFMKDYSAVKSYYGLNNNQNADFEHYIETLSGQLDKYDKEINFAIENKDMIEAQKSYDNLSSVQKKLISQPMHNEMSAYELINRNAYAKKNGVSIKDYDPNTRYFTADDLYNFKPVVPLTDEQARQLAELKRSPEIIEETSDEQLKKNAQYYNDYSKAQKNSELLNRIKSITKIADGSLYKDKFPNKALNINPGQTVDYGKLQPDTSFKEESMYAPFYDSNGEIVNWNNLYSIRKLGNADTELSEKAKSGSDPELTAAYDTVVKVYELEKSSENDIKLNEDQPDVVTPGANDIYNNDFYNAYTFIQENQELERQGDIANEIDSLKGDYDKAVQTLSAKGYNWEEIKKYRDFKLAQEQYAATEKSTREKVNKGGWLYDFGQMIKNTPDRIVEGFAAAGSRIGASDEPGTSDDLPIYVYMQKTMQNNVSNDQMTKDMGDVGKFFYNAMRSTTQSLIMTAPAVAIQTIPGAGQLATAAKYLSLFTMSFDAGSASMYEASKRGIDNDHAVAIGFASAVAEFLTEKVSLDRATKVFESALRVGSGSFSKNLLKLAGNVGLQGLTEASEEGASDILYAIADHYINGGYSEINQNIQRYLTQGMTQEEAEIAAVEDWGMELFSDMAAGAFSGMFSGGVYTVAGGGISAANRQGKVQRAVNRVNTNIGENVLKGGSLDEIRSIAQEYGVELNEAGKGNKQKKNIGSSVSDVYDAITKKYEANAEDTLEAETIKYLESQGVKNAAEVYAGYEQTRKERISNQTEITVGNENAGITVEQIDEIKKVIKNGEEYKVSLEKNAAKYAEAIEKLEKAANEDVKPTDFVDLEDVEVNSGGRNLNAETGAELGNVTVSGFDEKGNAILSTEAGEKISAKKVSFGSDDEAVMYKGVGLLHKDIGISEGIANDIISEYGNADLPAQKYVLGVREALRAGYTHQQLDKSGFAEYFNSPEQRRILERYYLVGENLAKKAVNSRVEKVRRNIETKKKEGKTSRKQGNITLDRSVNWGRLNSNQKSQMKFVAPFLTKGIGVNVKFFESEVKNGKHVGINGKYVYYDGGTDTIWIDVFAGYNGQGAILYTLGHELTHFMIKHNSQGAQEFFDFLFEKYNEKGFRSKDLLIEDQIEKSKQNGKPLSYDEAYEEVMADLCSAMLTDTDAAEKIIEYSKDKAGWKQALIERLKVILERLKKFFKYSNPDSYEGAAGKQLFNECKDLCERLESTLVHAVENYQQEGVQSSSRQVNEGATEKYELRSVARQEIIDILDLKEKSESIRLTETTPSIIVLQKGTKNLPMVMKASHIRENIFTEDEAKQKGLKVSRNINYHGLGLDLFCKVIDDLENVNYAFRGTKNAENSERRENYFLLISQHKDSNGNTINVPVYINQTNQYNRVFIDVNKISTVFGRPSINEYINREVSKGNLVRIKKEATTSSEPNGAIPKRYRSNASNNSISETEAGSQEENEKFSEKFSGRNYFEGEYDKPITIKDIEILRSIDRNSINEFTSEDIKKAQKWAYKFYKELGIKSPFFRAWFGDWRATDKSTIDIIDVPTIDISDAVLKKGDYYIPDTKWNIHAGSLLDGETRHHSGGNRISVKSLNALEKILENAVLLDTVVSENDTKKKNINTAFLHKLYSIIRYDGKEYIAKVTVEEFFNETYDEVSRRAYNLRSIKIEPANGQLGIASSSPNVETGSMISISNLFSFVKKYDKEFHPGRAVNPALLNEDGTPKVFYHGTDADFTAFDMSKGRSTMDIQGAFFSPWEIDAAGYGRNVGEYYLNIQNPAPEGVAYKALNKYKGQNNAGIKAREYLISLRYDGVNNNDEEFIAFYPEQIKSATDNIGTFDGSNPDIRYSTRAQMSDSRAWMQFQKRYNNSLAALLTDREYQEKIAVKAKESVEILKKQIAILKQEMKDDKRVTHGYAFNETGNRIIKRNEVVKAVRGVAKELNLDKEAREMFVDDVQQLYADMINATGVFEGVGLSWEIIKDEITGIIKKALYKDDSKALKKFDNIYGTTSESDLKEQKAWAKSLLYINPTLAGEIKYMGMSVSEFGKAHHLNLTPNDPNYTLRTPDTYLDELIGAGYINTDNEISEADALFLIAEWADSLYGQVNSDSEIMSFLKIEYFPGWINQIYEGFFDIDTLTTADKHKEEIRRLKIEQREKFEEYKAEQRRLRKEKEAQIRKKFEKELKAQKEADNERLNKYREKAAERLDKTKKEYQEKRKATIDKRKATALRNAIKVIRKDLADRIRHRGKNDRYIPQNLIGAVVDVCDLIDPTGKDPNTKAAQNIKDGDAALRALRDEYESVKSGNENDYADEHDKYISDSLVELAKSVGNTPLRDMTLNQLSDVYDIIFAIRGMIRDASKLVGTANAITNYEAGKGIIDTMLRVKKKGLTTKNVLGIRTWFTNPLRAAREMAGYDYNSQLVMLFEALNEGMRQQAFWAMKSNKKFEKFTQDIKGKENKYFKETVEKVFDDWGLTDDEGKTLKMTKQQAMQIVLSWERELANDNLVHMHMGGLKILDAKMMLNRKYRQANDMAQRTGPIGQDFIDKIKSKLNETDLAFMDAARKFFNGMAKEAVKEKTLVLKHRIIPMSNAYIPFSVDGDYVRRESEGVKYDASIDNMGMLQSVVKGAQQPIEITGLYNVVQNHIADVSKLYGLAIPIKNINKVLNVRLTAQDGGESVKAAITKTWGSGSMQQIQQAIDDLTTSRRVDKFEPAEKVREAFVVSTLAGNLSVMIKQAASLPAAGAYLSASSISKGTAKYLKDVMSRKSKAEDRYAEIDLYTARHYERRAGLSSAELGDFAKSKSKIKKVTDKMGKLSPFHWIQATDVGTTAAIWYATKEEIKSRGMKESDPGFMEAVAELYNKVIEETQPMYDSLHRVEASKNSHTKKVFIFQTQPMQNAGILREGAKEYKAAVKEYGKNSEEAKRAGKKYKKAVVSQIATTITFVMMTQFARAVLHKVNPWRDDETGEVEFDDFARTVGYEALENFSNVVVPWFGSMAFSLAEMLFKKSKGGNSEIIQEPVVDFINNTIDTFQKASNPTFENLKKVFFRTGAMMGLPLENVTNILVGAEKTVEDALNGNFGEWEASAHYTNSQDVVRLYNALLEGDKDKAEKVISDFDTKSSVRTSLNGYIKPLYLEAEENKDNEKITEIKKVMDASGLYVDEGESTVDKTLDGFTKNKKKAKWKNDFVEAYRAKDYATLNKIRQEMISSGYYAGSGKVDKSYDNVAETIKKWTDDLIE